MVQNYWIPNL